MPDERLPARLPRLPIFPLPNAQLFPHALLPLHVFEPRYRALTRDCLAGDKRMAVALLEPGYEANYEGRPAVRAVCGVGEIVESKRLPDGRYDIVLAGLARVRIERELPPDQPYRLVEAVRLDDHALPPDAAASIAASHNALLAVCDRLAAALREHGAALRQLARKEADPAACADVLAAALVAEPAERQDLLETLDPLARLDRVTACAAALLQRFARRGSN